MPYVHVENFSGGLDDRKSILTSAPGTLTYLNNAHLTAGGEIEKRKAFIPVFIFPPNIKCLGGWAGVNKNWLFGNGVRPAGLPSQFTWVDVRRAGVAATRLVRVVSWGAEPRALIEYPGPVRYWWAGSTIAELANDPEAAQSWTWPDLLPTKVRDICVLDQKLYTVQGSILESSGVAEPEKHGEEVVGSAVFDASKFGPQAHDLVALTVYQNQLVSFSKSGAVVWRVDPDPEQTRPLQFIPNFGCAAPRTIVQYGETDTFFLSYSGVRSIRARDSSNVATVSDVGSPINKTISNHMGLLLETDNVVNAVGCYEPIDGRYWVALFDVIYVLSFFPSSKVTAWSTYTPGFRVVDMWASDRDMFVLSDDTLYSVGVYRGNGTSDYDNTVVEVELPFIDAGDPASTKIWNGFDITCEGKWTAFAGFSIKDSGVDEVTNIVRGPSWDEGAHGLSGESTHVKIRLRSDFKGYAKLSNLAVHYDSTGEAG